jgi:photosystem II stability/assembly factor-like uncharacterized protein
MFATRVSTLATHIRNKNAGSPRQASGSPFYFVEIDLRKSTHRGRGLRPKLVAGFALMLSLGGLSHAQHWERLGPEGGMVVSLGASPKSDVYLGVSDGHVFASKDGARSWELRGRVGSRLDAVVTRLVTDPREENRVFAAVWYQEAGAGGGVFRSEDGGRTWELTGLQGEVVRALEIAPSQPAVLVAGTRSGIFRSSDGGKRWARISPAGDEELRNVDSLAIDPRTPEVIYAGTYHLPWVTRDGGKTWRPVIAGIIDDSDIMSLRLDETNPDRVYMSACSGIYRSENGGEGWTKLQGIPYAARRTQVIAQDPGSPKTFYAGTTEGLWVTRDGGEGWTRTTARDWVVNSVVVLAGENGGPGRVVLGTEGHGVQVSDDAGISFAESNRGFTHVVVKRLLSDSNNGDHLLMVAQKNVMEILESHDGGKTWNPISLATGKRVRTGKLHADLAPEAYASPWGWLLRLGNGQLWIWKESGKSWREWKLRLPGTKRAAAATGTGKAGKGEADTPLLPGSVIAFSQSIAVVSTSEGLVRCQESGVCAKLKAFDRAGPVRAVCPSFAGQDIDVVMEGKLGLSFDGGETAAWQDLPVSNDQVTWLDVAGSGPAITVFLGTSRGFYLSLDAGAHWKRVEGGLPAGHVERWLRHPRVWALTERDGGIYISQNEGSTWSRADQDSDRGRFTGLVRTGSGAILAGSQSEGLLCLEIIDEPGAPVAH